MLVREFCSQMTKTIPVGLTGVPVIGNAVSCAVLIPCFNEASTVAGVVGEFRAAMPFAQIYVYDNNSSDGTADIARAAGAFVRRAPLQGKGHVVRRMFADIEADVYVLVDGDGTYRAQDAVKLVDALLNQHLDFANGRRVTSAAMAYRPGHRFGNLLLTRLTRVAFGGRIEDMLSGLKVFSRRFVKSFAGLSRGFEIETELTIHAVELDMVTIELPIAYAERPADSPSKLNTYQDGLRIIWTIFKLVRIERPMAFFAVLATALAALSILLALPIFVTYVETGLVPRLPTAILTVGLMILAFLSVFTGLILDTVTHGRREAKRLRYLANGLPASGLSGDVFSARTFAAETRK
jgi:hypothetical protein